MKKLKNLFLKNIVLIFIFLTFMVCFDNPLTHEVKASEWDDWSFSISNKTEGHKIEVMDGEGYLGDDHSKGEVWNILLNRYKIFIVGIGGFATLAMVLIALFLFTKLSAEGANPQARSQTVKWIGCLLIASAMLGSITVIFSYSYSVFR